MPLKILIIDDDAKLQALLRDYFQNNSFEVHSALRGDEGVDTLIRGAFDMVILDIMLPDMDGFETLRAIRKTSDLPVLMLTARGDETDRIVGLEMGADDYLQKPFNPRELLARIKAILRRTQPQARAEKPASGVIHSSGVGIDPLRRRIWIGAQEIHLSTVEFDILLALVQAKGKVITRDHLMTLVRGRDFEAFDRSIDVHVSRIRKKIEDDPAKPRRILTVWGKGYRWPEM
ncbi:MAG: response regulator transcription factor [Desulfatitalea sp.]|nr:response regulator transcription factor [Desulfatitalea sp.]NNK02738.1 response regulator transcription factor [Desulfatitalea sp.]